STSVPATRSTGKSPSASPRTSSHSWRASPETRDDDPGARPERLASRRDVTMRTLRTRLCEMLDIEHPIIQAPMAGATTVDLVAAVCEAGALGGFGHAYTGPDGRRADGAALRARTTRPFAINVFAAPIPQEPPLEQQREAIAAVRGEFESLGVPVPDRVPPRYAPDLARQLEAVCDIRPVSVTGHLGDITSDTLARLRGAGGRVGG